MQSTTSMQSMVLLGGFGGMPPRKILKIAYSQTDFNGNFTQKSSSNTPLNTMYIDSL